jgi:hypothetical protein
MKMTELKRPQSALAQHNLHNHASSHISSNTGAIDSIGQDSDEINSENNKRFQLRTRPFSALTSADSRRNIFSYPAQVDHGILHFSQKKMMSKRSKKISAVYGNM